MTKRIRDLPELIASLSPHDRARFDRLFEVVSGVGRLDPPAEMREWIGLQFGSLEAVTEQRIVRITNRWTFEGSIFNRLRARRPLPDSAHENVYAEIEASRGDPFCQPETGTPADTFGRVWGQHSVTAANVAKYECWCAVIVFDEHDPLRLTEAGVDDAIRTASTWAEHVRAGDPEARYFFFMWNCLGRAGSSIVHGHAQAAVARGSHFAHVERWRAAAQRYGRMYFDDLYETHRCLGLGFEHDGVQVVAHLTPIKEKEVLLIAPRVTAELRRAIYLVLSTFTNRMGVSAFNLGLYQRPLGRPTWRTFPVIVRIVDRGDPASRNSDFGAMELFASSIIASDPFEVIEALKERFVVKG